LAQFMEDAGLSAEEARGRFYGVDLDGLVTESTKNLRAEQRVYARKDSEVQSWRQPSGKIELLDVVRQVKPSVLIGVSGQGGIFTEQVVREMAKHSPRPVIFPLSNPTLRSEATPRDLMAWTEGRALVGTGTAFDPVKIGGNPVHIAQTNNSYVFPGLALGIIASKAKRVTDGMVKAAAKELVRHLPTHGDKQASLLPALSEARWLARLIGKAVGKQAIQDGQAQVGGEEELNRELEANNWEPVYVPYERAPRTHYRNA
jgi:malate dehydrogenase (oxaloacetate-decarboxylating)